MKILERFERYVAKAALCRTCACCPVGLCLASSRFAIDQQPQQQPSTTMSEKSLGIQEYDEAGNLVATYVETVVKRFDEDGARVDVIVKRPHSCWSEKMLTFDAS